MRGTPDRRDRKMKDIADSWLVLLLLLLKLNGNLRALSASLFPL